MNFASTRMTCGRSRSNRRLAAALPPILILIAVLIICFARKPMKTEIPTVLTSNNAGMELTLPLSGIPTDTGVELTEDYAPISRYRRSETLNQLTQLRVNYQQLQPELLVWTRPGSDSRTQFSRELIGALTQTNTGAQLEDKQLKPIDLGPQFLSNRHGLILLCAPEDGVIAQQYLSALSPMLAGEIELRYAPGLRADQMRLMIIGTPTFTKEGEARFGTLT